MPDGVTVQGPDGKTYQFPAGTDKTSAISYFKKKGIGASAQTTQSQSPSQGFDATKPPDWQKKGVISDWLNSIGPKVTLPANHGQPMIMGQKPQPLADPNTPKAKKDFQDTLAMAGSAILPMGAAADAGILAKMGLGFLGGAGGDVAGKIATGDKQNPAESISSGLGYGAAPEAIGGALIKAGESMAPAAIKSLATKLFAGRMDVAGKAIDTYLSQPALSKVTVDVATPLNDFLDKEIERANRVGAKSLANRIEELKTDWNKSYNLKTPTLTEANAFKREVSKYTSYAGEANKIALNKIQKQATGITAGLIEKAAPGVKPLNEAYGNLAGGAKAARSAARKSTSGFTGLGLAGVSEGLKGLGGATPSLIRGSIAAVPSN